MKVVGVVFVVAVVCLSLILSDVAASSSIKLQRQEHQLIQLERAHPNYSTHKRVLDSMVLRGRAINMNGGYLTLGAYFMDIVIGTPPQTLSVLVDTGSSNTAVPVKSCTGCGAGPFYDPNKSLTSVDVACNSKVCQKCVPDGYNYTECVFGAPFCAEDGNCGFGITYGGGSSSLYGSYVQDNVCLAPGICGIAPIGQITEQWYFQTNFNSSSKFYGILGLAYPFNACNPSCTSPIWYSLSSQTLFPLVYGMCITAKNGGVLDLGYVDDTKYAGLLQWVPVITREWFNIALKDIRVGPHSIGLREFMYITTNDVIGAFVDSGTSIILISPSAFSSLTTVFETYYSQLPGVGGDHELFSGTNCISKQKMGNDVSKFPRLFFTVGGVKGDVVLSTPPESYLMDTGDSYCLGIQGAIGVGAVLGDVFMESYYVVFNQQTNQLGFAPVLNCV